MSLLDKIKKIDEISSDFDEEEKFSKPEDNVDKCDELLGAVENIKIKHQCSLQRKKNILMRGSSESDVDVEEVQDIDSDTDKVIWLRMRESSKPKNISIHNIFTDMSGPTEYAKQHVKKGQVKTAFSLILDDNIMNHIITCTEKEAFEILKTNWKLDRIKLDAFIALMYARGAYQTKNLDGTYLWNKILGPKFFTKTMNEDDFFDIIKYIHLDTEVERICTYNYFSVVSKIWNLFIKNSQNCYKPGAYITIGKQLFTSQDRCGCSCHKPDIFNLKYWLACDANSKYIINGFPYTVKYDQIKCSILLKDYIILKLMEPFLGYGRNVTINNRLLNVSMAKSLLAENTTIVGKIHGNKVNEKMTLFSSELYKSNHCSLTVYKNKPRKALTVLSSMHSSIEIDKSDKRVPETVKFYYDTKFAVDVAAMMARKYSVKSKSRKWQRRLFFNILDLAGINAWILYQEITGDNMTRQTFLFQLAKELAAAYKESRKDNLESKLSTSSDLHVEKTSQASCCEDCKSKKIKYTIDDKLICKKCNDAN